MSRLTIGSLCVLFLMLPAGCPVADTGNLDTIFPAIGGNDVVNDAGASVPADNLDTDFPGCRGTSREAEWRDRIFEMVNQARAAEGLDPVVQSDVLEAQASQYACEMIFYDFFDHVNPETGSTLGDRAQEFGYEFLVVGENLAAGQRTPEEAFNDWMNSPGHRRNILDPRFTELGVGIRVGGSYGVYWVQEFGRPVPESVNSLIAVGG